MKKSLSRPLSSRIFRLVAVPLLLAIVTPCVSGAPREDLKHTRDKIKVLRKELDSVRETRDDALGALRKSDQAISQTNRKLYELQQQQNSLSASLAQLNNQSNALQHRITAQQALFAKILVNQYRSGDQDGIRILLNGDDPERINRNWTYYRYLAAARGQMIERMRNDLAQLDTLKQQQAAKKQAIAANVAEQSQARDKLVGEQQTRKQLLARLSVRMVQQQQEIGQLVKNEKRLSDLVAHLAEARRAAEAARKKKARTNHHAPDSQRTASLEINAAALKGRLAMPVDGTITNRFGAPRPGGGLNWKGLFIKAPEGRPIHAVAAGEVVFSNWLRGFGNMMIIDHGGGLMSLYSNVESLLHKTGDHVDANETIATVGNSGGNPETGLYFEIRLRGEPVDPLAYTSGKH